MGFMMTAARRCSGVLAALMLFALVAAVVPMRASAAGMVGDGTPESCTEAALDAALAGGGLVTFNCGDADHTIVFSGQKTINTNTKINGGGKITLHGNDATRLFEVASGKTLELNGLWLVGGSAEDAGAIFNNRGTLKVSDSYFTQNRATGDGAGNHGLGGAIYSVFGNVSLTNVESDNNTAFHGGMAMIWGGTLTVNGGWHQNNDVTGWGGSFKGYDAALEFTGTKISNSDAFNGGAIAVLLGSATVTDSTLAANSSSNQGGALMTNAGTITVTRSLLYANSSTSAGGAIGIYNGTGTISASTIDGNTAYNAAGVQVGGADGSASIAYSTIAGNTATVNGALAAYNDAPLTLTGTVVAHNSYVQCGGGVTSLGYNLSQDASCNFTAATDQQNVHPLLGLLANNGGPTQTRMPEAGSPVISAGGASCGDLDQRGIARPLGGTCEIGAVEYASDLVAPVATAPTHRFAGRGSASEATIPVVIAWSASDDSGAIARYELQRSSNGGEWTSIALADATQTSVTLNLGWNKRFTFRVRAVDASGNLSAWADGPLFAVGRQEEDARAITWKGTWTTQKLAWTFGGATKFASKAYASATLEFEGTSVGWVSIKGPDRGRATVFIDGVYQGAVNLTASSVQGRALVWVKDGLAPGKHTIEVRVTGTTTTAASRVDVTGFVTLT
jgi:hypothetical protein